MARRRGGVDLPDSEAPTDDVPAGSLPGAVQMRRKVRLDGLPNVELEFDSVSDDDAIEQFKKANGIIGTAREFHVSPADSESTDAGDPSDSPRQRRRREAAGAPEDEAPKIGEP